MKSAKAFVLPLIVPLLFLLLWHVMAQAVQDLFPEAKLGIGPPIKDGFYYDFGVAEPFHPEDLSRIEKTRRIHD